MAPSIQRTGQPGSRGTAWIPVGSGPVMGRVPKPGEKLHFIETESRPMATASTQLVPLVGLDVVNDLPHLLSAAPVHHH
jgi:hypothetical protein